MPADLAQLKQLHANLRAAFVEAIFKNQCCRCPVEWGSGQTGALTQALSTELSKHGVPADLVDQRSQQAIQAIGSEQIQNALKEKNPWRALKLLGNNVRFKFILPNELSNLVAQNKGNAVGRKKEVSLQSAPPPAVALDTTKLLVMDGTFRSNGHQLPQISAKQIGPVACGIVLLSMAEAEPYLRSGKVVSTEPLAIGIFPSNGQEVCTALPHKHVTIPCRCTVNQEPLLAEAVVVQIGTGFVDKHVACPAITLDPLDVVSVKLMVYRDEYHGDCLTLPIRPSKTWFKLSQSSNDAQKPTALAHIGTMRPICLCESPSWTYGADSSSRQAVALPRRLMPQFFQFASVSQLTAASVDGPQRTLRYLHRTENT